MNATDGFQSLLARLQPLPTETAAAERHIGAIRSRLMDGLGLKALVRAGSYSRETSIRRASDVDLFAVLPREQVRHGGDYVLSNTALEWFARELKARHPSTPIRRDAQAIVVDYADAKVDVVPAFFAGMTPANQPMYAIPDGDGNWMTTSPAQHNAHIRRENEMARGKLRRVAQLIKFWRECRTPRVPLSSFHIEMVLASEQICRGVKSYGECLMEVLQGLAQRECRGLRDPLHISGLIPAVKSDAAREAALVSVRYSRDHAVSAVRAAAHGDQAEACRQWDIVFNGFFPKS